MMQYYFFIEYFTNKPSIHKIISLLLPITISLIIYVKRITIHDDL